MSDLIEAYGRGLRAAGYSAETIRERRIVLARAERALRRGLKVASAGELESWLAGPAPPDREWSRWTRYTYFEHLFGFYVWAVARRHRDRNPMDELTRPRTPHNEPRPASEQQLAIALGMPRPWRTAVLLAAMQGLRCAEIARLSRDDVTVEWLPVERKGGKTQLLPTHPLVFAELSALPPGPAVPTSRGVHFRPKGLAVAVSRQLTLAGLPEELTLHWFRHRYATMSLLPQDLGGAGADVRTVQELLGHASLASTQVYIQVTSAQRRAAVLALPVPAVA